MTKRKTKRPAGAGIRVKVVLPGCAIGPGKVALLEQIEEKGSISAAAKALGLSFRRAWHLIETLNEGLATPVVETNVGGAKGGGASLTATGKDVIRLFREIVEGVDTRSAKSLARLNKLTK